MARWTEPRKPDANVFLSQKQEKQKKHTPPSPSVTGTVQYVFFAPHRKGSSSTVPRNQDGASPPRPIHGLTEANTPTRHPSLGIRHRSPRDARAGGLPHTSLTPQPHTSLTPPKVDARRRRQPSRKAHAAVRTYFVSWCTLGRALSKPRPVRRTLQFKLRPRSARESRAAAHALTRVAAACQRSLLC